MIKIIILVDQLYSHGGIETLVQVKANYWAEKFKYNVQILSTEQDGKPLAYDFSKKVVIHDLAINYNRIKSYFSFTNLVKLFKNIVQLQLYLWKQKPDFVIVASHIPLTYVLPFLFSKAKIVKEYHFSRYNTNNSSLKQKVMNWIDSRYTTLVVLSEEEQTFYKTKNSIVIPNPSIDKGLKIEPILKRKNQAIFVGRLAPVKQLEQLILIWEQFILLFSDWNLIIVGETDSVYGETIKNEVIRLGLTKSVSFVGKSNEVEMYLAESKLLLLTSKHECFPMVVLESFSLGVPVISFNCPTGPRNIITNKKDGILVEKDDVNDFVTQLSIFASNFEFQKELSEGGLKSKKKYSLDVIMNLWKAKIFEK